MIPLNINIFRRKILKDELFRHTVIMLVGTKLGDLFNFLYRLALVRLLTVQEYGVLNSLISFSLIFFQFIAPFQPALSKSLAGYIGKKEISRARFVINRAGRDLAIFAGAVFLLFIFLAPRLAESLNINRPVYLILLGLLISSNVISAVPRAFLQGAQLFSAMAWITASSALLKLGVGLGLVAVGYKVSGGVGGMIAASGFILFAGFFITKKYLSRGQAVADKMAPVSMAGIYRYFIPASLMMGSFWVLTNIDVILVKRFFSPLESGYYSVAQMVGLIILFLPGTVTMVIFPKVAAARALNYDSISLLKKGLVVVAGFCLLGVVVFGLFPDYALKILTGKPNPQSVELVLWFSLAMSFYALSMPVIYYHLAIHNIRIVLPLVILAASEVATISLYHPALKSVLLLVLGYSIITFLVSVLMLKWLPLPAKQAESPSVNPVF